MERPPFVHHVGRGKWAELTPMSSARSFWPIKEGVMEVESEAEVNDVLGDE